MNKLKNLAGTPEFLKIAEQVLEEMPDIERDWRKFNSDWEELISKDNSAVSMILRCHLIIEHYLDMYLSACNPGLMNLDKARLSFSQKMVLADHPRTWFHFLAPGLRELNKLRNGVAHNLNVPLDLIEHGEMRKFLKMWSEATEQMVPLGLNIVEEFALFASRQMYNDLRKIERKAPHTGLPGFLEYIGGKGSDESH